MFKHSNGFGLIEVVIGAAIITVFLAAAINVFATSHRLESELIRKIEAQYLAEEGIEVARFLRDSS
jgi:prepilin-type N-terminal cleavage/methylation domain-containing protein